MNIGKEILFFVIFALSLTACRSGSGITQDADSGLVRQQGEAEITFRQYEHDFGKVTEGEKVAFVFSFLNKGEGDLVIASASTSCGCTVPKYDAKPIPPGGNGSLEVVFDTSGRRGIQTKTVTVRSNAKTPVVILKITAEIITSNNN